MVDDDLGMVGLYGNKFVKMNAGSDRIRLVKS